MKYTVQVFYLAENDDGKNFRATCLYHTDAADVGSALEETKAEFANRQGLKLGWIVPGHHNTIKG